MTPIPFLHIDRTTIPKEEHPGTTGTSFWQVLQFDGLRVRKMRTYNLFSYL
jgi:hypothetical protein